MTIRDDYITLCSLTTSATTQQLAERGKRLEDLLVAKMQKEGLKPRPRYRLPGEEVDGSFVFEGRHFIFEARWRKKRSTAADIYGFKGKVDGRLAGTIGLFISMAGYTADAADALSRGKVLNVLLFDRSDIDGILKGNTPLSTVLAQKLRASAERGLVFLPYSAYFRVDAWVAHPSLTEAHKGLSKVIDGLLKSLGCANPMILTASMGGFRSLADFAGYSVSKNDIWDKVILLADDDEDRPELQQTIDGLGIHVAERFLALSPDLAAWLSALSLEADAAGIALDSAEVAMLASSNPQLGRLLSILKSIR